ncbi:MAG: radical SAM/SPASM domain-containing protein [Bacteroidota bacterium]
MKLINRKIIGRLVIKYLNSFSNLFSTKQLMSENYNQLPTQILKKFNKSRFLGPQKLLCYAPLKMMYFAFNGEVIACCHNRKHIMGRYPEESLDNIWNGKEYNLLRDFIAHDDLSHGCEVCKHALLAKNFDGAKNSLYDRYQVRSYPQIMEFELDNRCNLACVICSDLFSSTISIDQSEKGITPIYDDEFVRQLETYIPHLKEVKFYGGEPFLINIYYTIWEKMLALNPNIQIVIQTNGTVLNERIMKLLERGNFNINISIDSLEKENFEKIRKNASFEEVMSNVAYFEQYCKTKGTNLGIIPTPNRLNWQDLPKLTNWASKIGAKIYFNTLVTPLDLALWNLTSDELEEIITTLYVAEIDLQHRLANENAHHFADFISQLKSWQSNNNQFGSNDSKIKISLEELQILRSLFLKNLSNSLDISVRTELLNFFQHAFSEFDNSTSQELFFAIIQKIPIDVVVEELSKKDSLQLKKIIGKKIYEAGNEYQIIETKQH